MIVTSSISLLFLTYHQLNVKATNIALHKNLATFYGNEGLAWLRDSARQYNEAYETERDNYKIYLEKNIWGAYDLYSCLVLRGRDTVFNKKALMGYGKNSSDSTALLLGNSKLPLYISRGVEITGYCFVPFGNVKSTFQSDKKLPPEHIFKTTEPLPAARNINAITDWVLNYAGEHRNTDLYLQDSIANSFYDSTIVLSGDSVFLSGQLMGNIIVNGNSIVVEPGCRLQDVILLGDYISIADSFSGNIQAISTRAITIGSHARFTYPSAMLIMPLMNNNAAYLLAQDSMQFEGDIYGYSDDAEKQLKIEIKDGRVTGCIYCSKRVQLYGQCYGQLICDKLIDKKGVQENFISDVILNIDSLPSYYSYNSLYPMTAEHKVVKWLK